MKSTESDIDAIAEELINYLNSHGNPADTLQGINDWWLRSSHAAVSLYRLKQALQKLVDMGVLEINQLPDGAKVYRKRQTID